MVESGSEIQQHHRSGKNSDSDQIPRAAGTCRCNDQNWCRYNRQTESHPMTNAVSNFFARCLAAFTNDFRFFHPELIVHESFQTPS